MKECKKCGEQSQGEFYASQSAECKKCTRSRVKKNRELNSEYYKEFDRNRTDKPERIALRKSVAERWKKDPELKKRHNEQKKKWLEKNKIKRAAHIICGNAIKSGKLMKQPCVICGDDKSDAHHEDYNYPMDVIWFCKKHHGERHRQINEERRLNQ